MLKSHERFHSTNGKRLVLIVDDEFINREMLRSILQSDYEVILAENGREALEKMRENQNTLSLVLLDLMMPVMDGREVLKQAKGDSDLESIPIIVLTGDEAAEVESLSSGAADFIPKPYPNADVILARIRRTIELSEDRQIINSTERDPLTGLYHREYFYLFAEQYDRHHENVPMDAIVVDVNHFHMINERFGTAYGDDVLRRIGEAVREMVLDTGGIVCRREADTFMVYCPHGQDYGAILERASIGITPNGADDSRVRLRMGVYMNVDKSLDIERRFDRAKSACDTVKGSFTNRIGYYDGTLHDQELYAEQLIDDFKPAIRDHQFQVYFQPKFDVQPEIPVLASAEALVRWQHPQFGLISPGMFIPLFENNGLIQALDEYVWRETAAKIRDWKERFNYVVPVSVNVSRIDMYDPHLVDTLKAILAENGLTTRELLLEITESAYTQDSEQIIDVVNELRSLGFRIEMDDFGTGYSSLNMISTLPIDALKLDMQFIRNAFSQRKDTRMLEVIIEIADYLSVPVIAEGVETEEQMLALRAMGCDYVQGYYFSRPVPADEYEHFVAERNELDHVESFTREASSDVTSRRQEVAIGKITHALSSGFEAVYYIDVDNDYYVVFSARGKFEDLQIESSGLNFFEEAMRSIPGRVYADDQKRVALSLSKETLLSQLVGPYPFSMTYRVLIDGVPTYYSLKAVRARTHDDHHIVLGVSNVDAQIRQAIAGESEPVANELSFGSLASALSNDLESVYYVDVENDTYLEFAAQGSYKDLHLELSGEDFFGECQLNLRKVVYLDDRDGVAAALSKETLLRFLDEHHVFSMIYRLVIDGKPVYYNLKAVWASEANRRHIVIGVSNVDNQMAGGEAVKQLGVVSYASIVKALAGDYFSIYYVNSEDDSFVEYSAHELYDELEIERSGDDFFTLSRENMKRVVHPDDVDMLMSAFTKENILAHIERDKSFTLTYRLIFKSRPVYVHLKAMPMEDASDPHIVVGISTVDSQIRREQEHAQVLRQANHDVLTGVKSKHAYAKDERKVNAAIHDGRQAMFAVVACGVDGWRQIRESLGPTAGEQYMKDACAVICRVFKHSPVYRVGADEFAVILRGDDYAARDKLMAKLEETNRVHAESGGVLIAGGLAEYQPGEDGMLASVFGRADAAMCRNKRELANA